MKFLHLYIAASARPRFLDSGPGLTCYAAARDGEDLLRSVAAWLGELIGFPVLPQNFDQAEDFTFILPASKYQLLTTRPLKMADSATVKTSWADDVEVELEPPKIEDYVDENGIRITVEYTVNDEGKKLKV